ncbi:MAG: Hpt domain-containing protein, partial [Proteobacteria bacterium]|nr:Hpt domain-containing protein [Pseudomonadota bacterium]
MLDSIKKWLWMLCLILHSLPVSAEVARPNCFSCNILVKSLRAPLDLSGTWLFTRNDKPENKLPARKTADWVTVDTPGPWSAAYKDGETFRVGWYRANLNFDPKLLGRKAVFYVDAHISSMQVFLDGELLMQREGKSAQGRYGALQAVPVEFNITKAKHVIALRIDSRLMTGIYQKPFQLRASTKTDAFISFYRVFFSDGPNIAAYVLLMFGLFFLFIYNRTDLVLYSSLALTSIAAFPFLTFTHDTMTRIFSPESLFTLHFIGLIFVSLGLSSFSQIFNFVAPKVNQLNNKAMACLVILFLAMTFKFNLFVFQILKMISILFCLWLVGHAVLNFYFGVKNDKRLKGLLLVNSLFFLCLLHDLFFNIGLFYSINLSYLACAMTGSVVVFTGLMFFSTAFFQNRVLLQSATVANLNLQNAVALKTHELDEKSQSMNFIMQSFSEGILTVEPDFKVSADYSSSMEDLLDTALIAGVDVFELLFVDSSVPVESIVQMRSALEFSFGESELNFEANRQLLVSEFQSSLRFSRKILALDWNPVLNQDQKLVKILLAVRDVSKVKQLEKESHLLKLRSKIVETLLDGSGERIKDFVRLTRRGLKPFLEQTAEQDLSKAKLATLYRVIHTIKGSARTFDLLDLAECALRVETELAALARRSENIENRQVERVLAELLEALQVIDDVKINMANVFQTGQRQEDAGVHSLLWDNFRKRWAQKTPEQAAEAWADLQRDIEIMSYRQAGPYFRGIMDRFKALAESLGKPEPNLVMDIPSDFFLDPILAKSIVDILVHMIRNSLDHGIELPDDRLAMKKPRSGQITIQIRPQSQGFILDYVDDGRGLDLKQIRARAMKLNLPEAETTDIEALVDLVFRPGFTTSDPDSDESERGVGLQIVAQEL